MLLHLTDRQSPLDIPIQHLANQLDAPLAHHPGNPELMVKDLVNIVEGVFFVDEGVEENTESPNILFLATIGFTLEDFWGGVICEEGKR